MRQHPSWMLLLISDHYLAFNPLPDLGVEAETEIPEAQVPTPEAVAEADTVLVLGEIVTPDRAIQLSGALQRALAHGRTVILAYPMRLDGSDLRLYERLVGHPAPDSLHTGVAITHPHPAFRSYFEAYGGYCGTRFSQLPDGAETLGGIEVGGIYYPSALEVPIDRGHLYVVPWHAADLAQSHAHLVRSLVEAVSTHQSGAPEALPEFLADVRLHGEATLLRDITEREAELAARRTEADVLRRLRHLLGKLQGDDFEEIVIEALNAVLSGTGYHAEDREDVSREDFWIVGPDGDDALAEAKAMGGGVPRGAVSQVDAHRSELGHETDSQLPGLLVANQYRNDDNLERRHQAPHPNVLAHLGHQNVLLLRSVDLYELASRKRQGEPVGDQFIEALHGGGGWLDATADGGVTFRRP